MVSFDDKYDMREGVPVRLFGGPLHGMFVSVRKNDRGKLCSAIIAPHHKGSGRIEAIRYEAVPVHYPDEGVRMTYVSSGSPPPLVLVDALREEMIPGTGGVPMTLRLGPYHALDVLVPASCYVDGWKIAVYRVTEFPDGDFEIYVMMETPTPNSGTVLDLVHGQGFSEKIVSE